MNTLHQNAAMEVVLDATDIGGANATSKYLDMSKFASVDFFVTLGTTLEGTADGWNAADKLDSFKIRQATDSSGTSVKDIVGAGDTSITPATGAAGDTYVITVHAAALDHANNFDYVACYVAESDNTGVDTVTIAAVRYNPRYAHDDLTSANHAVAG